MAYTEAQKRAAMKYMAEKTDDVRLRVSKGTKERWKESAQRAGDSMTVYISNAVERQIELDRLGEHEIDPWIVTNLIDWLKKHGHENEEVVDCLKSLEKKKI